MNNFRTLPFPFNLTISSMLLSRMLHNGDTLRFVESQGLNKKSYPEVFNDYFHFIYLNLLLVEDTLYLTELQSERQCPHWDKSISFISFMNWMVFHGSQLGSLDISDLGRYQGIHCVSLKTLVILM